MRIWCHGDGVIHKIWLNLIQSQNNYIFKSFLRTTIVSNHRITKKSFYQMPTKFTSRSVSYIISPICVTAMFLYLDCISIKFVHTQKKKNWKDFRWQKIESFYQLTIVSLFFFTYTNCTWNSNNVKKKANEELITSSTFALIIEKSNK